MSSRSTDLLYTAGNTGRHVVVRRSSPEFWPSTFAPVGRSRTAEEFEPDLYDDVDEAGPSFVDSYAGGSYVDVDRTTDLHNRRAPSYDYENEIDDEREDAEYRYEDEVVYDHSANGSSEYEVHGEYPDEFDADGYTDDFGADEDGFDSDEFGRLVRYDHVEIVTRLLWRFAGVWGVVYLLVATSAFWR